MAGKSMGQFIQALRKANGMTQQNVADGLGVSNKAVSRWERDECAPDISVIPALAEMLGVTCDELLKGERIINETQVEKSVPRVEKQLKVIVNQTISRFKTLIWISMALSFVGLIAMFGVSYGFYRRVVGFGIELVLVVVAVIIAVIAVSRMKDARQDNELFEDLKLELDEKLKKVMAKYSYMAFFTALAVVVLSFPLLYFPTYDMYVVLTFESYLLSFLPIVVLLLAVLYFVTYRAYTLWVTGQREQNINKKAVSINRIQIVLMTVAGVLFLIAPYFIERDGISNIASIIAVVALVLLALSVGVFFYGVIAYKKDRNAIMLPCLRNVFIAPIVPILSRVHYRGWYSEMTITEDMETGEVLDMTGFQVVDSLDYYWLVIFIIAVIAVIVVYEIMKRLTARNKMNN
ncbi:MAG: helix-turn-helix transcriptional regulator [Lachnospira sp.]|nr:helix-turn-helix transcriptional regulator [Lachnospira sp.]